MNSSTIPLIPNLTVKLLLSALPLSMKLDENLTVKTTLSWSAAEQPPVDSV